MFPKEFFLKVLIRSLVFVAAVFSGFYILTVEVRAVTEVGGTEYSTVTWTKAMSPIVVLDSYGMGEGGVLTIEPGVIIKFKSRAQLGSGLGYIKAIGTPAEPIIFTAFADDTVGGDTNGDGSASVPTTESWQRITLSNNLDEFSYVEIRHARACLQTSFSSPSITHSKLSDCTYGTYFQFAGANTHYQNNDVYDNGWGIVSLASVGLKLEQNNIYDNSQNGVLNEFTDPTWQVDARNNWWGYASGPFHATLNPNGQGNRVNNEVLFDPWLSQKVVPPSPTRNPVIIIPGILGSELLFEGEKIWLDLLKMLSPSDGFLDVLMMDMNGDSIHSVEVGDIVRKVEAIFTFDHSQALLTELGSHGYIEDTDLFIFPYDWRDNVENIDNKLNEFIQTRFSDNQKVDIIAHSMGGLIVKEYIRKFGKAKIDKLIFVGTPHLGAPKAAKTLIYGDQLGIPFLNHLEIQKIGRNMPALYQLLSNQVYFSKFGGYIKILSRSLDYSETKNIFASLNLNTSLIDKAEGFYSSDMNDLDLSGINTFNINGCNSATIGSFKVDPTFVRTPANIRFVAGDETVPLGSSSYVNVSTERTFYVKKVKHGTMMTFEPVRKLIAFILAGLTVSDSRITQDVGQCKLKGKQVSVFSLVDVKIIDQDGNYAGPDENNSIENSIPGLVYELLGEEKFIFLPTDNEQEYEIELDATEKGAFGLKISEIDEKILSTAYYHNIGIIPNSLARFSVSDTSDDTVISFDYEGDSDFMPLIAFSHLNEIESQDETLPVTEIVVSGTEGINDWYRSTVELTLKVTDDNSGVFNTEYSLDDGVTWQVYLKPVVIAQEGFQKFFVFSVDKAGNKEEVKKKEIKIDKTAPEINIVFNPSNLAVEYSGKDNLSGVTAEHFSDMVKFIDEAGNTTVMTFKERNKKSYLEVEMLEIRYNGIPVALQYGSILFDWAIRDGVIRSLKQKITLGIRSSLLLQYNSSDDRTIVQEKNNSKKTKEVRSGLILLKIKTNEGEIIYDY